MSWKKSSARQLEDAHGLLSSATRVWYPQLFEKLFSLEIAEALTPTGQFSYKERNRVGVQPREKSAESSLGRGRKCCKLS